MEHACKACGKGFSSLKAVWSHECRSLCGFKCSTCERHFASQDEMKKHKKTAHRSEKWEVSPKFEKHSKVSYSVENICKDMVTEIIERCLIKCGDDLADVDNVAPAKSFPVMGMWVADPTLPEGWKTCVISKGQSKIGGFNVPEKRMFYSPCGKLFTNRLALERFLEEKKKVAVQQKSIENEAVKIKSKVSPQSEVIRPADLCLPKMESLDSEDDASDAISLSDEDFEDFKEPHNKRKYQDDELSRISPKSKKQKFGSDDLWSTSRLTPEQEKILVGSYEEWPVPFPGLVNQLVKDTGLQAGMIEDWFGRRTDNCLRMLFGSVI